MPAVKDTLKRYLEYRRLRRITKRNRLSAPLNTKLAEQPEKPDESSVS